MLPSQPSPQIQSALQKAPENTDSKPYEETYRPNL